MTDIVERLRDWSKQQGADFWAQDDAAVLWEAADKIERLRARVAAARREALEEAAKEVDCGCDIRDAVLARLEDKGEKYAGYLCSHGDVCCALQAAAIRALLKEPGYE